jgi:hypothetical protein
MSWNQPCLKIKGNKGKRQVVRLEALHIAGVSTQSA